MHRLAHHGGAQPAFMRCDMIHPASAIARQFGKRAIGTQAHQPPILAAGNRAILGIGAKRQHRTIMRFMPRPGFLRCGDQRAMQNAIACAEDAAFAFMPEGKPRDPGAKALRNAPPIQQIIRAAHALGGVQRAISALIFASSSPA